MKRGIWLVLLGAIASCSDQDQTLGETRPSPPASVPAPALSIVPTPAPTSTRPSPTIQPCEDRALHARVGACVKVADCRRRIALVGYECEGETVCCDYAVSCPPTGCGAGGTNPQGDESAGAAGKP